MSAHAPNMQYVKLHSSPTPALALDHQSVDEDRTCAPFAQQQRQHQVWSGTYFIRANNDVIVMAVMEVMVDNIFLPAQERNKFVLLMIR